MPGYCQHCGAAHDDAARFCPKCGQPLATPQPVATPTPAPMSFREKYAGTPFAATPSQTAWAPAPTSSRRPLVIGAVIALVVVALIGAWQLGLFARLTSSAGTAGNIPPTGQIWFGSSFDPSTFALSGITTTARTGTTVALVARLPRTVSSGDVNMHVSLNGTLVLNQPVAMTGSGDLFGSTVTPFVVPGTYKYELVDVGGNVLASGTLTVA